jgi:cytochrome P450
MKPGAGTEKRPSKWRSILAATDAYWRSLFRRTSLPPDAQIQLDDVERGNRKILLELAAAHGPIFKAKSGDKLCVCVVDLTLGRRLLKNHADALRPEILDLRSLFPEGFMRQMEGDCHRRYRDRLNRGLNAVDLGEMSDDLAKIASKSLASYSRDQSVHENSPHEYASVLGKIANGMLIRVFFGAMPGAATFKRLIDCYHRLGPHGLVWNITEKQSTAFAALRDELRAELDAPEGEFDNGLLGRLAATGEIDDTLLGNLIYMVEIGRYDLRLLLRWISKYAAENSDWIDRIRAECGVGDTAQTRSSADAFVLETLRMDQSERLLRNVKKDIEFEGFIIPKGAMVRVCMWESHKDGDAFPDPFHFDPGRFVSSKHSVNQFSPFGIEVARFV